MKNRHLIFYLLVFLTLGVCILYLTPFTGLNHDFSQVLTYTRLAYLGIAILILFKVLHLIIKADIKEWMKKTALTTIALLSLACLLEGVFMHIPRSHGAGGEESLAARIWFSKYWEVNSLGYRDKEITEEKDKINIMVVGDSFVAGHGIKDPTKRFSNLLQDALPDNYRVYNLGLNGADTQAEYSKLLQFPLKPDLIILSHHPNDIERVPRITASLSPFHNDARILMASILPFSISESLVNNSYLINYFFWKFNPITSLEGDIQVAGKEYYESEAGQKDHLSAYLNKEMFTQHLKDVYQFSLLSREESIPLVVILFPETWDETIEFSEVFANKPIEAFLQREGIPVLDLYPIVKAIPVKERIVNNNDAHPSELLHQKVAESLQEFLASSNLINKN